MLTVPVLHNLSVEVLWKLDKSRPSGACKNFRKLKNKVKVKHITGKLGVVHEEL
jgi:hypothetical protein